MVNCREASLLASVAHDRPLGAFERLKLAIHRLLCPPCRVYRRQLDLLRAATAQMCQESGTAQAMPEDAKTRLRARLAAPRTDQDAAGAPPAQGS